MSQIGSPVPNIRFGGQKNKPRRYNSNKNFSKVMKRMSLVNRGDISPLTPMSATGRKNSTFYYREQQNKNIASSLDSEDY